MGRRPHENTTAKKNLRAEFTALRKNIFQPRVSKNYFQILQNQNWFQKSNNIAIYISQEFEFPTQGLFEFCQQHQKKVFAPVVSGNLINFHKIESWENVSHNHFDIAEPVFGEKIEVSRIDIFFVPLVAFDWNGNRLGRGKGYYDILFSNPFVTGIRIGMGFEYQSALHVPHTEQDTPMNFIFTNKQLRKIV